MWRKYLFSNFWAFDICWSGFSLICFKFFTKAICQIVWVISQSFWASYKYSIISTKATFTADKCATSIGRWALENEDFKTKQKKKIVIIMNITISIKVQFLSFTISNIIFRCHQCVMTLQTVSSCGNQIKRNNKISIRKNHFFEWSWTTA